MSYPPIDQKDTYPQSAPGENNDLRSGPGNNTFPQPAPGSNTYPQQNPEGSFDPMQQGQTHYVVHQQSMSTHLILFLVGFCFPPIWWVGSCFPKAETQQDFTWRKITRIMSCISIVFYIALIVFYAVFFVPATIRPSATNPQSATTVIFFFLRYQT